MGTRKSNRKTNKGFRKTRSKRQRGGGITCSRPGSCIVDGNNIGEEETQENLNELLIWASQRGQIVPVGKLLDAGANVNATDINGSTALLWASENGYIEIVEMLLAAGANVNAMNTHDWTALIRAITSGNTEIVKMLLDAGANVNASDNNGNTALIEASINGQIEITRMLLDKGADIHTINNHGDTALKLANSMGRTEIVKLLKTYKIEQTFPRHLERQKDKTKLDWSLRKKNIGNRGDGTMPHELRHEIMTKYLGGKRRRTRRKFKRK